MVELSEKDLMDIDGGCTGCKVGATLLTVGAVLVTGATPAAWILCGVSLYMTWV